MSIRWERNQTDLIPILSPPPAVAGLLQDHDPRPFHQGQLIQLLSLGYTHRYFPSFLGYILGCKCQFFIILRQNYAEIYQ